MVIARRVHARPQLVSAAPSHTAKKSTKKKTKSTKHDPGAVPSGRTTVVGEESTCADEEIEPESENNRLREQLLRVLVDHQRQEEEIVALRALARSLKEEVELIQKQNSRAASTAHASGVARSDACHSEKRPHEFFKLDLQVEQLHAENVRLRDELFDSNEELETLRAFVNSELPQFKIIAVQARAELECVKSQLHDEKAHCDRLEAQVAHYKARSNVQVPSPAPPLQGRQHGYNSTTTATFGDYKTTQVLNEQSVHTTRDASRRERENFLLQCRLSAVRGENDDDKENSDIGGNLRDSTSDADAEEKTAPPDPKSVLSRSHTSSIASSSSRASSSSAKLLLSSRVHRDLSVLDDELHALHQALREIPHVTPVVHQNGSKTKQWANSAFLSICQCSPPAAARIHFPKQQSSRALRKTRMEDHFARVLDDSSSKRPHEEDGIVRNQQTRRKKASTPAASSLSTQELDALVANASAQEMDQLDARALKSMANALDKLIRKNALLRSKYPDAPEKFMDSEIALDAELTKWKQVAAAPASLYPMLVELQAVPMLLGLFAHENLDIRLDVVALLADLTDVDDEAEEGSMDARLVLVHALLEHKLLALLVVNLQQLDVPDIDNKEEEAAGIYNTLQILENLADLEPKTCAQVCATTDIFQFLLKQVGSKRKFSQNKLYASEILSILLQSGPQSQEQFIKLESVVDDKSKSKKMKIQVDLLDDLLQAIAPYRKRDPASEEEEEFVENLVNSLCSVLLLPAAQNHFRRLEGIELVLRCMKDRAQYVFRGALRILDHTIMGNARNCERLVEVGGLKVLFSVFMGKKKSAKTKNKRAKGAEKAKEEENIMSIMTSLCTLLTPEAKYDVLDRFHAKFVENDMEKLDRVVDLFVKYLTRVEQSDLAEDDANEDEDEEDGDEDERYLRRLDAGLFTLQRITHVVAHLCEFSKKNRAYVMVKFHERSIEMDVLTQILKEQLEMLGTDNISTQQEGKQEEEDDKEDGEEKKKMQAQKKLLLYLLSTLREESQSQSAQANGAKAPSKTEEKEDTQAPEKAQ